VKAQRQILEDRKGRRNKRGREINKGEIKNLNDCGEFQRNGFVHICKQKERKYKTNNER